MDTEAHAEQEKHLDRRNVKEGSWKPCCRPLPMVLRGRSLMEGGISFRFLVCDVAYHSSRLLASAMRVSNVDDSNNREGICDCFH